MDNKTKYKLEHRYYLKFCKISKFLTSSVIRLVYRAIVFIPMIIAIIITIKAYLDPDMDFSIITLILNLVLFFIWASHCAAVLLGGFIYVNIILLYFNYEFRQIKEKIQKCIKSKNSCLVIDAIHEHNYYSKHIHNFNRAFSFALFAVYFLSAPAIDILLHLALQKSVNEVMRMLYILCIFHVLLVSYIYTYVLSTLSSRAHDVTSDLYSFIVRNRSNRRNKLKISAFIEKLCGPTIGIYCYNLFAYTPFEFYKYVAFVSSTYILMDGLLFVT